MTTPLNPQQFGPFVPRGPEDLDTNARMQSISGGFDKMRAAFPNGKPGYYPPKDRRKPFTLSHLLTAAAALGADRPN